MVNIMKYLIYYLIGINILSFIMYGLDKRLAIKKQWRISEHTLIVLGFIGGCLGSIIGMNVFHHKTKKIWFWIGNILFLIGWVYYLIKAFNLW